MQIIIREARREDTKAIHGLITELAVYEKEPEAVKVSVEELEEDGFGPEPAYRCIVAEREGEVVGFALYFIHYSTWKGKTVYLEDFLVKAELRGMGIGSMLFERIIDIAKSMKVRLLLWQVLEWNEPAIRFYEKYNSVFDGEWLNGKIYFREN